MNENKIVISMLFVACTTKTEIPTASTITESLIFHQQQRYITPIKDDYPQNIVELMQFCSTSPCYLDALSPPQKQDQTIETPENFTKDTYYFLHSEGEAFLYKNSERISKKPQLIWYRINGVLSYCIGDPLQLHNKGANIQRRISLSLHDQRFEWLIQFVNPNICGVHGNLRIGTFDENIDTNELWVDDIKWTRGGSELLHEKMLHAGIELIAQ